MEIDALARFRYRLYVVINAWSMEPWAQDPSYVIAGNRHNSLFGLPSANTLLTRWSITP